MRYWGLEPTYDAGRMIDIYLALQGKEWGSLVDVACGTGIIADGLKWVRPLATIDQFDIEEYPEWRHLNVRPEKLDVNEFIKRDRKYDVVLFLNSYRNTETGFDKAAFDEWLLGHAKYFITSGGFDAPSEYIGQDVKNYQLKLYTIL